MFSVTKRFQFHRDHYVAKEINNKLTFHLRQEISNNPETVEKSEFRKRGGTRDCFVLIKSTKVTFFPAGQTFLPPLLASFSHFLRCGRSD